MKGTFSTLSCPSLSGTQVLLPPPLWRWHVEDDFVRLNQPLRDLLGLDARVSCDDWRALISPADRPAFFASLDTAAQGARASATVELTPDRGQLSPVRVCVAFVAPAAGTVLVARVSPLPGTSSWVCATSTHASTLPAQHPPLRLHL